MANNRENYYIKLILEAQDKSSPVFAAFERKLKDLGVLQEDYATKTERSADAENSLAEAIDNAEARAERAASRLGRRTDLTRKHAAERVKLVDAIDKETKALVEAGEVGDKAIIDEERRAQRRSELRAAVEKDVEAQVRVEQSALNKRQEANNREAAQLDERLKNFLDFQKQLRRAEREALATEKAKQRELEAAQEKVREAQEKANPFRRRKIAIPDEIKQEIKAAKEEERAALLIIENLNKESQKAASRIRSGEVRQARGQRVRTRFPGEQGSSPRLGSADAAQIYNEIEREIESLTDRIAKTQIDIDKTESRIKDGAREIALSYEDQIDASLEAFEAEAELQALRQQDTQLTIEGLEEADRVRRDSETTAQNLDRAAATRRREIIDQIKTLGEESKKRGDIESEANSDIRASLNALGEEYVRLRERTQTATESEKEFNTVVRDSTFDTKQAIDAGYERALSLRALNDELLTLQQRSDDARAAGDFETEAVLNFQRERTFANALALRAELQQFFENIEAEIDPEINPIEYAQVEAASAILGRPIKKRVDLEIDKPSEIEADLDAITAKALRLIKITEQVDKNKGLLKDLTSNEDVARIKAIEFENQDLGAEFDRLQAEIKAEEAALEQVTLEVGYEPNKRDLARLALIRAVLAKKIEVEIDYDDSFLGRLRAGLSNTARSARDLGKELGDAAERSSRGIAAFDNVVRGLFVFAIFAFLDQLIVLVVSLTGALAALASSALSAGAALGGAFVAGIGQAIPAIGVFAAFVNRIQGVFQAVKQANLLQQQESYKGGQAANQQARSLDGVVAAQERVKEAQQQLTEARKEAREALEDLILSERKQAVTAEQARSSLNKAVSEGGSLAVESALIGVAEADKTLGRTRGEISQRTASGIDGSPEVTRATKQLRDAQKAVQQARQSAVQAGGAVDATTGKLDFLLAGLSKSERQLYRQLIELQNAWRKFAQSITDPLTRSFTFAARRITGILEDKRIIEAGKSLSESLGSSFTEVFNTALSPSVVRRFLNLGKEFEKNLKPVTRAAKSLINIFLDIAEAGSPALREIVKYFSDLVVEVGKYTSSTKGKNQLTQFFSDGVAPLKQFVDLFIAFGNVILALMGPGGGMEAGATVLKQITDALNDLAAGIRDEDSRINDFFERFFQFGTEILPILAPVIESIASLLDSLFTEEGLAAVKDLASIITDVVIPAFKLFLEFLRLTIQAFETLLNDLGPLSTIFKGLIIGFISAALITSFVGRVNKLFEPIYGFARWLRRTKLATRIWDSLTDKLKGAASRAKELWDNLRGANREGGKTPRNGGPSGGGATPDAPDADGGGDVYAGGPGGNKKNQPDDEDPDGRNTRRQPRRRGGLGGIIDKVKGFVNKGANKLPGAKVIAGAAAALAGLALFGDDIVNLIKGIFSGGDKKNDVSAKVKRIDVEVMNVGKFQRGTDKPSEGRGNKKEPAQTRPPSNKNTSGPSNRQVRQPEPEQKKGLLDRLNFFFEGTFGFPLKQFVKDAEKGFAALGGAVKSIFKQIPIAGIGIGGGGSGKNNNQKVSIRGVDNKITGGVKSVTEAALNAVKKAPKKDQENISDKAMSQSWIRLRKIVEDTSQKARSELNQLRRDGTRYVDRLTTSALNDFRRMRNGITGRMISIRKVVATQLNHVKNSVYSAAKYIQNTLNQALKDVGSSDTVTLKVTKPDEEKGGDSDTQNAASGGWIGNRGERGRDTVRALLGRGEAVLNWGHQKIVEPALQQTYGFGLDGLFDRTGGYHAGGPGRAPGFARGRRPARGARDGVYTASVFSDAQGYKGDALASKPYNWAELGVNGGVGNAFGGLPYKTRIKVSYRGRSVNLTKLDIGSGGPGLGGKVRAVDIWQTAAQKLRLPGLANVYVSFSGKAGSTGGALAEIAMPKIEGGTKAMRSLVRGITKKMADAANEKLEKETPIDTGGGDISVPRGRVSGNLREAIRMGQRMGLTLSSFLRPGDSDSFHSQGRAADLSGAPALMARFFRWALKRYGRGLTELFYDPLGGIDNGQSIGAIGGHTNHVHIAFNKGGMVTSEMIKRENQAQRKRRRIKQYADGGTVDGSEGQAVPIIAHAGEWILNKRQQKMIANLAGTSSDRLKGMLGFSGGPTSYQGGGSPSAATRGVRRDPFEIAPGILTSSALIKTFDTEIGKALRAIGRSVREALTTAQLQREIRRTERQIENLKKNGTTGKEKDQIKVLEDTLKGLRDRKDFENLLKSVRSLTGPDGESGALGEYAKKIKRLFDDQVRTIQLGASGLTRIGDKLGLITNKTEFEDAVNPEKIALQEAEAQAKLRDRLIVLREDYQKALSRLLEASKKIASATALGKAVDRDTKLIEEFKEDEKPTEAEKEKIKKIEERLKKNKKNLEVRLKLDAELNTLRDRIAEKENEIIEAEKARFEAEKTAFEEATRAATKAIDRRSSIATLQKNLAELGLSIDLLSGTFGNVSGTGVSDLITASLRETAQTAKERYDALKARLADAVAKAEKDPRWQSVVGDLETQVGEAALAAAQAQADVVTGTISAVEAVFQRGETIRGIREQGAAVMERTMGVLNGGFAAGVTDVRRGILQDRRSGVSTQITSLEELLRQGGLNPQQEEDLRNKIAELTKTLESLDQDIIELNQTTRRQLVEAIQARTQRSTGLFGSAEQILANIARAAGVEDPASQVRAAQATGDALQGERTDLITQITRALGSTDEFSQQSRDLLAQLLTSFQSGDPGSFANLLFTLGPAISALESTLGETERGALNELINSLVNNSLAVTENTANLRELNGLANQPQPFSTTSWTRFRAAIFNGLGDVLPQFQIPQMATGGYVTKGGMFELHPGEFVVNPQGSNIDQGDINITVNEANKPLDVTALASRIAFEKRTRK